MNLRSEWKSFLVSSVISWCFVCLISNNAWEETPPDLLFRVWKKVHWICLVKLAHDLTFGPSAPKKSSFLGGKWDPKNFAIHIVSNCEKPGFTAIWAVENQFFC